MVSINVLISLWCFTVIISTCALEGNQLNRFLIWPLLFILWTCIMWCTIEVLEQNNIERSLFKMYNLMEEK
mgnify:FL=1